MPLTNVDGTHEPRGEPVDGAMMLSIQRGVLESYRGCGFLSRRKMALSSIAWRARARRIRMGSTIAKTMTARAVIPTFRAVARSVMVSSVIRAI